jgi:multidrug efflux pump subunit AcrA (membrane-fusion protein)
MKFVIAFLLLTSSVAQAANAPIPSVFAKKAKLAKIYDSLDYPGRIEAKINAFILAESDGVISKVLKPLGTPVKKFEKLIVVQNTDPVYQYAPMQIENVVSGVVSQVYVTEGSRVAKGDKLMLVTDPAQLRIIVEVPSSDLKSIHKGDRAELTQGGDNWDVKVRGVSPFVDPSTGTANCELEFTSGQKNKSRPPAGALAKVSFKADERNGISIADSAVFYRGKDTFVRVIRDKHAFLQPIKVGKRQFGQVEILTGLKENDEVVERTSSFISDGEEVKVEVGI